MRKINNFGTQKTNFNGQENSRSKKEAGILSSNKEEFDLNGAEILASQGKAFVNMQGPQDKTNRPSLEDAKKELLEEFDQNNPNDQYLLEKVLRLSKDNDENRQTKKILLLTRLCKDKTRGINSIENIFDLVQWNSNSNIIDKQILFLNKLFDKDIKDDYIGIIFRPMRWERSDAFLEKQTAFLDGLLDKKLDKYCVEEIFETIQWDEDDKLIDKQMSLMNNMLDNNINEYYAREIFERIQWDKNDDIAEKQILYLNKMLNSHYDDSTIKEIFETIQWDGDNKLTDRQTSLLEIFFDKNIKGHQAETYYGLIQWNKSDELIDKQIVVLSNLLEKDNENIYIGGLFKLILRDKSDEFQKNQMNFLNNLSEYAKLKNANIFNIFSSVNWGETGKPNKNQLSVLNSLLEKDNMDGDSVCKIFSNITWDKNGKPSKNQMDFLNELFEYCKDNMADVSDIFSIMGWHSDDKATIEERKEIVRQLLNEHPDSDKIWPNYEDSMLLLRSGILNLLDEDTDYNQGADAIAQDVIERMVLVGIDENTKNNIKSVLTKALKNPRQFLDDIPLSHTEMETRVVNDKGKIKSFYKIDNADLPNIINMEYKKRIAMFFIANAEKIAIAGSCLDKESLYSILDKRLTKSREILNILSDLSMKNCDFIKDIFNKNDKYKITINDQEQIMQFDGSGSRKVELANMIEALQTLDINSEDLFKTYNASEKNNGKINLAEGGIVDFDKISDILRNKIMEKYEIFAQEEPKVSHKNKFNGKYMYTLAHVKTDMMAKDLIKAASCGDFTSFIEDINNTYGKSNLETKNIFKESGLSFDKWTRPNINNISFNIQNKKMTIKLWDRNPYEDLFVGNKTSCCTAIGHLQGKYMPSYILNKAFNLIEMYDDKNEVVGMSRVYIANVNGKPSLIIDNIELNNNYGEGKTLYEERIKIRNNFFKYASEYAKQVTGNKDTPVYFSKWFTKVPNKDLNMKKANVSFIGKLSDSITYMNILGSEQDVGKTMQAELYEVPKEIET